MNTTANYKLKKPGTNEFVSIDDINDNMDVIDKELKESENKCNNANENFNKHISDKNNPHNVTSSLIGAVSTIAFNAHVNDVNNPHSVTPSKIGAATDTDLKSHTNNKSNPHSVTPAQIGAASDVDLNSHTGNKSNPHAVTASQVGALPIAGGTLTGQILSLYNQLSRFLVNAKQLQLEHYNTAGDTSNRTTLLISSTKPLENALILGKIVGGVEKSYKLFGEHNKPSGSYVGNGSATSRTVDTGAINGSLLYVDGNNGSALVTGSGAICISTGGTATYLKQSEAKFLSGVLTLATTNSILNANRQNMSYHAK